MTIQEYKEEIYQHFYDGYHSTAKSYLQKMVKEHPQVDETEILQIKTLLKNI